MIKLFFPFAWKLITQQNWTKGHENRWEALNASWLLTAKFLVFCFKSKHFSFPLNLSSGILKTETKIHRCGGACPPPAISQACFTISEPPDKPWLSHLGVKWPLTTPNEPRARSDHTRSSCMVEMGLTRNISCPAKEVKGQTIIFCSHGKPFTWIIARVE